MRKTRSDSKLLNLPEEQQAQLAEWLLSGVPYHQAREMVSKEFGVVVLGLAAFSEFWQTVCAPALIARRQRAVTTAEEIATEAGATPGRFDAATIDALKQRAFELSISPGANPKDVKAIFALVLKARDQDINERKVALLEAQARKAEAAESVTRDASLTPEQREARMREIFGLQKAPETTSDPSACAAGASVTLDPITPMPAATAKA